MIHKMPADEKQKVDEKANKPAVDEKAKTNTAAPAQDEAKKAPEPDPEPAIEDTPDEAPVEEVPLEAPLAPESPAEFDIREGDVWTSPAGYGETVTVVGFDGVDPVVVGADGEERTVDAATLAGWRHDGPTHHEAGAARL